MTKRPLEISVSTFKNLLHLFSVDPNLYFPKFLLTHKSENSLVFSINEVEYNDEDNIICIFEDGEDLVGSYRLKDIRLFEF